MNAVFDPSLLFISDTDWFDEEKQDAFLEHLTNHLEIIDEYDICKIWWTDELQTILVGNPTMHPWFGSDLRNPIIVTISQKFYNRIENIIEFDNICEIKPNLTITYNNQNAQEHFLKLAHTLIEFNEKFYFSVGIQNILPAPNQYIFQCDCHNNSLEPTLLNMPTDWLQLVDIIEKFFPKTIDEFDEKFEKGMDFLRKSEFNNKKYLFDFEFTKNFKKSVISRTKYKENILSAIVKKLISTSTESANSELHDEFISKNKINEWRIRVTQRPSSTRIHYILTDENKVKFVSYYGEGEHDEGI